MYLKFRCKSQHYSIPNKTVCKCCGTSRIRWRGSELARQSCMWASKTWVSRRPLGKQLIETLRYPFSVYLPVPVRTSRPLFTPEKRPGYRVAWWLVITKWEENMGKYGKTWCRTRTPKSRYLKVSNVTKEVQSPPTPTPWICHSKCAAFTWNAYVVSICKELWFVREQCLAIQ